MAYRNGVYVAFDANGEKNPTQSDLRYFELLKGWKERYDIDFKFNDSHSKTYQVRDDSKEETLIKTLRKRMSESKSILVILSKDTNYDRGLLNEEIKWAVEDYDLPVIVAYTGLDSVCNPILLRNRWPKNLAKYIDISSALGGDCIKCIHIAFKEKAILEAINTYRVDDKYPKGPLDHYDVSDYRKWGCLDD